MKEICNAQSMHKSSIISILNSDIVSNIIDDAKKMHQVSVDSLANSKVVAGIIGHIKSQANRGFFGGTEYFTDELDVEFIDRNKKD